MGIKKRVRQFKGKHKTKLLGKTIKDFQLRRHSTCLDEGYLDIWFTDGTGITVMAYYGGYDPNTVDEYVTRLHVEDEPEQEFDNTEGFSLKHIRNKKDAIETCDLCGSMIDPLHGGCVYPTCSNCVME